MATVNIHEAKTRLSQLILAVEHGEAVVIARNGTPVAQLVPVSHPVRPVAGAWSSAPGWSGYRFDPAVLAPLETDEELAAEGWPL